MGLTLGERPGEDVAGAGRRLESAGAPAAVHIKALDRQRTDDRRRVGADVDDTAPAAHHAQAAEDREQLEAGGHLVLDDVERAALRVGVEAADAGAHDELALSGLPD